MDCTCNVTQRRLTPGVFNLKQYLNEAETMTWRLTTHMTDGGTCDLCDYDAFLVLSVCGKIDEIMLTKSMVTNEGAGLGDEAQIMELTWNVGTYATDLAGYVKYQIVFRSSTIGTLGVIGSTDEHANGTYTIDNELATGTGRTWTNNAIGSGYKIKWDATNSRWAIYEADGTTLVDYQTFSSTEPCCGTWNGVAVGNTTAAAWYSDEAIMYISETIAADQNITARFPTILRQVWEAVKGLVIRSGVSVRDEEITAANWTGNAAPYTLDINALLDIPAGMEVKSVELLREKNGGGYETITNAKFEFTSSGGSVVSSFEKIAGKVRATLNGGNGYFISHEPGTIPTSYIYMAYASDNAGTGFSLTPTNSLKWRAEFSSTVYYASPTLSDFNANGAVWIKYIGDDGNSQNNAQYEII